MVIPSDGTDNIGARFQTRKPNKRHAQPRSGAAECYPAASATFRPQTYLHLLPARMSALVRHRAPVRLGLHLPRQRLPRAIYRVR